MKDVKTIRATTIDKEKKRLKARGLRVHWWLATYAEQDRTYDLLSRERRMPLDLALYVASIAKDILDILGKPPAALDELVHCAEVQAEEENSHIPPVLVGLGLLKGIALGLQVSVEDVLTMAGVIPLRLFREEVGLKGAIKEERKRHNT